MYAYKELKKELENVEEVAFLFNKPLFTGKCSKEILESERNIFGSEFEAKIKSDLLQKKIARECADWIQKKVRFKSNVSGEIMPGFVAINGKAYTGIQDFTKVDLGAATGNNAYYPIVKTDETENSRYFLKMFDEIWNDTARTKDVTKEVLDRIAFLYNENSPEFLYFVILYKIFSEFLDDITEDKLPNEATGFKDSKIWNTLYQFQKDAAVAIVNKLEKYNGCILADSVGLGKTFTALAVVKYYESRNRSVLILCPKKLAENWNTYKSNYINNPLAADRLRYDVLFHTDLSRDMVIQTVLTLEELTGVTMIWYGEFRIKTN